MNMKLGPDGDLDYREGVIPRVTGSEAVRQNLEVRLRTFYGEWFLDESLGVPYHDDVMKKNPDLTVLNAVFTRVIVETTGIVSLNELNFELENDRTLSVTLSATAEGGDVINLSLGLGA